MAPHTPRPADERRAADTLTGGEEIPQCATSPIRTPGHRLDVVEEWEPRIMRRRTRAARDLLADLWARLHALGLTPRASAYLRGRGLCPYSAHREGVCATDRVTWARLLSEHAPQTLADAGLASRSGRLHPARWHEWLVFPYFAELADLQTMRLRTLDEAASGPKVLSLCAGIGITRPALPYGAPDQIELAARPGYGPWPARRALYVVEGEIDALTIQYAGRRCIGIPGTGAWRTEWCAPWLALDAVIVLADGDEAGAAMATTIARDCIATHGAVWTRTHLHLRTFASRRDANDHAAEMAAELAAIEREIATEARHG